MGLFAQSTGDADRAIAWYTRAGEGGNPAGWYHLGAIYTTIDYKSNPLKGFGYFQKAAESGFAPALRQLGICYRDGIRIGKDRTKATEYFQKAADEGDMTALSDVVLMCLDGLIGKMDAAAVRKQFQAAADAGDPAGMFGLGLLAEYGVDQDKSRRAALALYETAGKLGYKPAERKAGELGTRPPTFAPLTGAGLSRMNAGYASQFHQQAVQNKQKTAYEIS